MSIPYKGIFEHCSRNEKYMHQSTWIPEYQNTRIPRYQERHPAKCRTDNIGLCCVVSCEMFSPSHEQNVSLANAESAATMDKACDPVSSS
jgi:hypothetical protein